jgi:DNA-binding GntR family transcriptional regulator
MQETDNPDKKDLTMLAFNGIKNLMFRNEITRDLRLNARELAKKLDMSPTPVVQALKLLHFQGILGHIPNKGYFIETNTPEMVRDIFNLRMALEAASLNTLLARITPEGWQKLDMALTTHLEALEKNSPKLILLADMAFHITLAQISTGPAGERLMRNLFEMLYLKNRSVVLYISPKKQFGFHHKDILDLLQNKDIQAAQTALGQHIEMVRDAVITSMREDERELKLDW